MNFTHCAINFVPEIFFHFTLVLKYAKICNKHIFHVCIKINSRLFYTKFFSCTWGIYTEQKNVCFLNYFLFIVVTHKIKWIYQYKFAKKKTNYEKNLDFHICMLFQIKFYYYTQFVNKFWNKSSHVLWQ